MSARDESIWGPADEYNNEEVMDPGFRLESGTQDGRPCRNLYLQVFERFSDDSNKWRSLPQDQWHLLACISEANITMYPVYTNPHTLRYLNPKHGRFETVVYEDDEGELPDNVEGATLEIETRLPWKLFDEECRFGLGLDRELEWVWRKLMSVKDVDTLVVRKDGPTRIEGKMIRMDECDLDAFRLEFNRVNRAGREHIKQVKQARVRHDLLFKLDPERFPRIVGVRRTGELVEMRRMGARQSAAAESAERRSSVRTVRNNLNALVSEAPRELLELHADIERVTLATMIEKYEGMLDRSLSETQWQRFFEDNTFVLTMIFARAVHLLHTQFHARGSSLDGSGAQIGDFLFGETGSALAIVEIKTPGTELVRSVAYRNRDVYGPSNELGGAVTQVLYQQSALRNYWLMHREQRPELRNSRSDVVKCVVIAGRTLTGEAQRYSFDVFRNACKDVEVITYDELLEKLKLLLAHLTPPAPKDDDVPF